MPNLTAEVPKGVVEASLATSQVVNLAKTAGMLALFGEVWERTQSLSTEELKLLSMAFFGAAAALGLGTEYLALRRSQQSESPGTTWVNAWLAERGVFRDHPRLRRVTAILAGFAYGQILGGATHINESAPALHADTRIFLEGFMVRTFVSLFATVAVNGAIMAGAMEPVNKAVTFAEEKIKAGLAYLWRTGNFDTWDPAVWPGNPLAPVSQADNYGLMAMQALAMAHYLDS